MTIECFFSFFYLACLMLQYNTFFLDVMTNCLVCINSRTIYNNNITVNFKKLANIQQTNEIKHPRSVDTLSNPSVGSIIFHIVKGSSLFHNNNIKQKYISKLKLWYLILPFFKLQRFLL